MNVNSSKVKELCPMIVADENFNKNWEYADFTTMGDAACADFMFYMGGFFVEVYKKYEGNEEMTEKLFEETRQLKLASMAKHERKNILNTLNRELSNGNGVAHGF